MPHGDIYIPEEVVTFVPPSNPPNSPSLELTFPLRSRSLCSLPLLAGSPCSPHHRKTDFYAHTLSTLESLLDDEQTNWITALSNASSLLYHSFLSYPRSFGATEDQTPVVNWCG